MIRIVTDSSCDLSPETVATHGITVVPLTIRFGDDEYLDRVDLTTAEFWAKCAASPVLPATAAPSQGQYEAEYRRLADEGATGIVVPSLSSALSATMQSAQLAAEALADVIPVRVVDSRSVSVGLGTMAVAASAAAAGGADIDQCAALVADMAARTHVWGALDNLDALKKGGRIGGAKAMLATALSIKPIIEVRDGAVHEGGKQRTRAKALAFLVDKFRSFPVTEGLAVMHADCSDIDQFLDMLRPYTNEEILVGEIGAVIGTHAGRGTIGLGFRVPA